MHWGISDGEGRNVYPYCRHENVKYWPATNCFCPLCVTHFPIDHHSVLCGDIGDLCWYCESGIWWIVTATITLAQSKTPGKHAAAAAAKPWTWWNVLHLPSSNIFRHLSIFLLTVFTIKHLDTSSPHMPTHSLLINLSIYLFIITSCCLPFLQITAAIIQLPAIWRTARSEEQRAMKCPLTMNTESSFTLVRIRWLWPTQMNHHHKLQQYNPHRMFCNDAPSLHIRSWSWVQGMKLHSSWQISSCVLEKMDKSVV